MDSLDFSDAARADKFLLAEEHVSVYLGSPANEHTRMQRCVGTIEASSLPLDPKRLTLIVCICL